MWPFYLEAHSFVLISQNLAAKSWSRTQETRAKVEDSDSQSSGGACGSLQLTELFDHTAETIFNIISLSSWWTTTEHVCFQRQRCELQLKFDLSLQEANQSCAGPSSLTSKEGYLLRYVLQTYTNKVFSTNIQTLTENKFAVRLHNIDQHVFFPAHQRLTFLHHTPLWLINKHRVVPVFVGSMNKLFLTCGLHIMQWFIDSNCVY